MANNKIVNKRSQQFIEEVAFISGGSKGIGKETAKEIFNRGGSVCILARNEKELERSKREIESVRINKDQFVITMRGDASKKDEIQPLIEDFIRDYGVPDYLINAVGYAYPEYVQNYSLEDFKANMDVNYFGQLIPTMIFIQFFMREQKGHISFISSGAGFASGIGYATYSPTKFAIVGLAEVIRHELKPYNISISILYPPDTDTPGLKKENETKPKETAMISETFGLYKPDQVAVKYLNGIKNGKFYILFGDVLWVWRIFRLFPRLFHRYLDYELVRARKKIGKR